MTRVLFLTESFHPVLGGGEGHIRDLSRRLAAAGVPCTVLTRRIEPGWAAAETLDGVRVLRVGPAGRGRRGKYAMVGPALAALSRERRAFDVLVVRGTRVLGLPGVAAARALGKAVVLQPELNGEASGRVYTWGTPLDAPSARRAVEVAVDLRNVLLRDADAVVAMSRAIADEFRAARFATEKIALMPHGVDTARYHPASVPERGSLRRRLGLDEAAVVFIYTGRLLRGKGLETLIEAFAAVAGGLGGRRVPQPNSEREFISRERNDRAHLLLVGSGEGQTISVEPELKQSVRGRGLEDRVTFTGRVEDVASCLGASDVFVFPSEFEALGLSLIEAAACGLPAVGARTGGIVDVIEDGASGLLFPPGDTAALTAAMRALLADAGRRAVMGRRAREIARERFDVEDSVARYAALFRELRR